MATVCKLWRGIRRGTRVRVSAPSAEHTASSMADKDQDVWIKVPSGRPRAMPGHGVWCGSALSLLASMGALAIRWHG